MPAALAPSEELELANLARACDAIDVLVLFGSAAQGRLVVASDLDLYVRLSVRGLRNGFARETFIAAAAAVSRRDIDLVVESPSTSVILRREVAGKGRALFERRAGAFRQLVVDAVGAYVDLEPSLRSIGSAIRERAAFKGSAATARILAAEEKDDLGR